MSYPRPLPHTPIEPLEPRQLLAPLNPIPVSDHENVSQSPDMSEGPSAAAFGDQLAAVWGERFDAEIRTNHKTIAAPWPTTSDLIGGGVDADTQFPDLTYTPDGTLHAVFANDDGDVYHIRKLPGASAWSNATRIAIDDYPNPLRIASTTDGVLWIIWRNRDGTRLHWRRSESNGLNWTGAFFAMDPGNMSAPELAAGPNNTVVAAWYRRDAAQNGNTIRIGTWNGSGWSYDTIGNTGGYAADPAIAIDAGRSVHLVYRQQVPGANPEQWNIKYTRKPPGLPWTPHQTIRTTSGNAGYAPSIAVDHTGGVHITWSELVATGRDVFYSHKLGLETAFRPPVNVSQNSAGWNSRSTVVTTPTPGGRVAHVFYQRGLRGQDVDDIYYRALSTTVPVPDILDVSPDPRGTPVDSLQIAFSEPVTGFDLADLNLAHERMTFDLKDAMLTSSDGGRTWTLANLAPLTGYFGNYTLSFRHGAGITNAAGNVMPDFTTSETWQNNILRGTNGPDSIRLRYEPVGGTPGVVKVYLNGSVQPAYEFFHIPSRVITIETYDSPDTLIIESPGPGVPRTSTIRFDGGDDTDTLEIVGTPGDDVASFNLGEMGMPIWTVESTDVERRAFHGGAGNDTFHVLGGVFTFDRDAGLTTENLHLIAERSTAHFRFETNQRLAALTLSDGATADTTPGANLLIDTRALSLDRGILDLADNSLILRDQPDPSQSLANVEKWIAWGRQNGKWQGGLGLNSSAARDNPHITLAPTLGPATFSGGEIDANDVLVKYTYDGDANLDGRINADDYFKIDSAFLTQPPTPTYTQGDFNFDDKINADDYFLIDSAFLAQASPLAASNDSSPLPSTPSSSTNDPRRRHSARNTPPSPTTTRRTPRRAPSR